MCYIIFCFSNDQHFISDPTFCPLENHFFGWSHPPSHFLKSLFLLLGLPVVSTKSSNTSWIYGPSFKFPLHLDVYTYSLWSGFKTWEPFTTHQSWDIHHITTSFWPTAVPRRRSVSRWLRSSRCGWATAWISWRISCRWVASQWMPCLSHPAVRTCWWFLGPIWGRSGRRWEDFVKLSKLFRKRDVWNG